MSRPIRRLSGRRGLWPKALSLALACSMAPSVAQAQTWTSEDLGAVLPVWLEQMAAVNDHGDVAWPAPVGSGASATIEARVRTGGTTVSLHNIARPTGFGLSFASDINSAKRVAGYFANEFAENKREARLWFPVSGSWNAVDLHAAVPTDWVQSAALSVVDAASGGWIAVGMSREKIHSMYLPQPTVWLGSEGSSSLQTLDMDGFDHGIARAVARTTSDSASYACGAVGTSGAGYNIAACWDLNDSGALVVPAFAGASDHLTSSWSRVRAVEVAPGVEHIFAGGTIFYTDGSARAVLQNLSTGETIYPLELTTGASTLFGDVSGYFPELLSTSVKDYGLRIFGLSTTLSQMKGNLNPYTHIPFDGTPLRAVQTDLLPGDSPGTAVSMANQAGINASGLIDNELSGLSAVEYAFAASRNGEYLLSFVNGSLHRLARNAQPAVQATLFVRDLETRTSRGQTSAYATGSTATPILYHWFKLEGLATPTPPAHVYLAWSDEPGFGTVDEHVAGCDAVLGLAGDSVKKVDILDSQTGTHHSEMFALPANYSNYRYMRVFYELAGSCQASVVSVVEEPELNFELATNAYNPYDAGKKWGYCYGAPPPGNPFDTDLNTSFDHCGTCTTSCGRANMDSWCATGSCVFGPCDSGWVDLNENTVDGCECEVLNGGVDRPGLNGDFIDENCDGVDGDASISIFVATGWGADTSSCGSRTAPCATIQYGLTKASSGMDVLVAGGTYVIDATLNLKNGVGIHGGYAPAASGNWARSASYETKVFTSTPMATAIGMEGNLVGVRGQNLSSSTTLSYLSIETRNLPGLNSSSNYGIQCVNCTGLSLHRLNVTAGSGSAGKVGSVGQNASSNPGTGSGGGNGSCDGRCWVPFVGCQPGGLGGAGGYGTTECGATALIHGGRGGQGGHEDAGNGNGTNGSTSGSPETHNVVIPGGTPRGFGGASGTIGSDGGKGNDGDVGDDGAIGAAGIGGVSATLNTSLNLIGLGHGLAGDRGSFGLGGGGGGGGGGQRGGGVDNGPGNGGGGGGGGGCGGSGGKAGHGGGHSVGIILVQSGGANVVNTSVQTSSGGTGGVGGVGGEGRDGANGGAGARACDKDRKEIGFGGTGGKGGKGGPGGQGGGGAGGNSVPLVTAGGLVVPTGGSILTSGSAGTGGSPNGMNGVTAPSLNL